MSYLVDGNNVMGQRVGWHKDKAGARRRLLDELSQFALARHAIVRAVFDGAPDQSFPDGSRYRGVTVFYAEKGSDADERIKRLVEAEKEKQTLKVVTSDRQLAEYVRRCGVQVIRSGEFRKRLDEINSSPHSVEVKPEEPSEGWMRFFGVSPDDDE
jgi:predicted RNA-binding protein with PIN domain